MDELEDEYLLNYEGEEELSYASDFDEDSDYSDFDDQITDIDFSNLQGKDFKKSFSAVNRKIKQKKVMKRGSKKPIKRPKPLTKKFGIGNDLDPSVPRRAFIKGKSQKKIARVIVPRDKKVIVEGVSKFILSKDPKDDAIRNIGYYKGEKLNELVLTFNNNSALDFNLQLFNPSMPLDYLQSTSLNLNDKIQVAGNAVAYTDVLYNLLANPALLVNAKFVFAGPSVVQQISIPLEVQNKQITGVVKIQPLNLALQIDTMQVASDIVFFDIMSGLNRPFIPDGMDVMGYKILPGMTVTMAFFYKQKSLKKILFEEARNNKKLL